MFFIRLLSYLPLPILYGISDFLFFVSYRLVRYRRKMVWSNLQNAFPEKSHDELRAVEKAFFKNLCDYAVEMIKLITISKEELGRRMKFKTPELPEKYAAQNQSILILASHQFNWEWLLTAACFNLPMTIDFVYQAVSSQSVNELLLKIRSRFGAHAIRRDAVARETVKRKNILRAIAIVADQYPGYEHDKKFSTKFLGQDTVFFHGANQLAVMMQYPVLYYEMKRVKRGYYETNAIEIASLPYARNSDVITESYVQAVEKVIRENPSGWLWSHNRWKKRHIKTDA